MGDWGSKARPTTESQASLKAHYTDLDRDPTFVADFLKAQFVEDVYRAMGAIGLNKNTLAKRLGKTRQYVGRILNESANFTFRTVAEIACSLGWQINVRMLAPDEHLSVVRKVTQHIMAVDLLSAFHAQSPAETQAANSDYEPEH